MLFKDIAAGRYTLFNRMNDEKRASQVETVKYIEMVAATSGIDISNWDCQEVFGEGNSNAITTNKNEVNRRLFEKAENIRSALPPANVSTELSEVIRESIKQISARAIADQIARAEDRAASLLQDSRQTYRRFEQYLTEAASHRASVAMLRNSDLNIDLQVQTINNSNYWEYVGIEGGQIVFMNRSDVIVAHKNQAAGIDITVNLGKYKVYISLSEAKLRVKQGSNNINSRGYIHPHVNSDGYVCWGNAADAAAKALSKMDIVQIMGLLGSVLVAYTPGTPYQSIEEFHRASMTEEERDQEEQKRNRLIREAREAAERERAEEEARRLLAIEQGQGDTSEETDEEDEEEYDDSDEDYSDEDDSDEEFDDDDEGDSDE